MSHSLRPLRLRLIIFFTTKGTKVHEVYFFVLTLCPLCLCGELIFFFHREDAKLAKKNTKNDIMLCIMQVSNNTAQSSQKFCMIRYLQSNYLCRRLITGFYNKSQSGLEKWFKDACSGWYFIVHIIFITAC